MGVSRSITLVLLSNYAFVHHRFTFRTAAELKRSTAFYAHYRLRILRLSLPQEWNEPLIDNETGQSQLPESLISLTLGMVNDLSEPEPEERLFLLDATAALDDGSEQRCSASGSMERELQLERRVRYYEKINRLQESPVQEYGYCKGSFDQPIPPGALRHGLCFLQFNATYKQPLQVGSIPDTVEVLQFGTYSHQLERGHLPASLTHLVFGSYRPPILPGVLPAGLRRLHLGGHNQPLRVGALPSQLQYLSLGDRFAHPLSPGTIPSSVTHLRLSDRFSHTLQVGSVPHGVHYLHLGSSFNHPLPPRVLPASLRELMVSSHFNQCLEPGSLPAGLEALAFPPNAAFQQTIHPGVIPASVIAVAMSEKYEQEILAGSIPATVRLLRLPSRYSATSLSAVLSPLTRVIRWETSPVPNALHTLRISATRVAA